jgi:hypothetical protein
MRDHNRRTLLTALLTGVVLATWMLIANVLGPPFIEHAYRAPAPSILGDLLPRRARLPLEHYLARVEQISLTVSFFLALGGLGLIAATRPPVQRYLERSLKSSTLAPGQPAYSLPLNKRRRLVVNVFIAVCIGGHVFDIVTGTEHWPFSHYGMFSGLTPRHISAKLYLYGVSHTGDVPLNVQSYFVPLDDQRVRGAILKIQRRSGDQIAVESAIRYVGARYEYLRQMGAHHGPPLFAMKLVAVSWTQHEWAENKGSPDSVRVLYEIPLSGGAD